MIQKALSRYRNLSVVAKSSFWALFCGVIQRAVSVAATPIFTRMLTTQEYAQYSLYQSWQNILQIFVCLNVFNYATYTAMVKFEDDKDGFITSAQTLVTLFTMIGIGIYYFARLFAGDILGFPLPVVILMFFEILFFSAGNLWQQRRRYEYQYRGMTAVSLIIGIMGPLLGMLAVYWADNPGYGRIYGSAAVHIVVGFALYICNIVKSRKFISRRYWKYILVFCVPLIPHFLSTQILSKFDRIMIDRMCSTSDVAVYSLAYNLSMLMLIVSDALLAAYTPYTYQCIKEKRTKPIRERTSQLLFVVALSNILLILLAPEAVALFATEDYYEAIYIIPAVSASVYFMFLFNLFANIEYYYSETKYVALASIIAAVVNIGLNFIFIQWYGYIAAAYTTLISYVIYSVSHYIFMQKVTRKYNEGQQFYNNKSLLAISIIFVVTTLCVIPLYQFMIIRYVLMLGLCVGLWIKKAVIIEMFQKQQKEINSKAAE